MKTLNTVPTLELLQAWSNDSEAARKNLRSLFASLSTAELAEWSVEALENCGVPLESDRDFLAETLSQGNDNAYWGCKLIGRLGEQANGLQKEISRLLTSENAPLALRQQAALTLGAIGSLTAESRDALKTTARSSDPRLSRLSTQSLGAGT